MEKIIITIETTNAAFHPPSEIACEDNGYFMKWLVF